MAAQITQQLTLVVRGEYADQQTLAAFTTEEAAQAWADACNLAAIAKDGKCDTPAYIDDCPLDLDPAPPSRTDA